MKKNIVILLIILSSATAGYSYVNTTKKEELIPHEMIPFLHHAYSIQKFSSENEMMFGYLANNKDIITKKEMELLKKKLLAYETSEIVKTTLEKDFDGNGKITSDDFKLMSPATYISPAFARLMKNKKNIQDSNDDGIITFEEMRADPRIHKYGTNLSYLKALQTLDKNSDDDLTLQEVKEESNRIFKSIDLNHDDQLSTEEKQKLDTLGVIP
jgi:hypothetical protein